jgi:benzylsuccinate CoA-transferase BbsE subunit
MVARGISYDQLKRINPAIVMTSITPFGQTGPYAEFESDDIVCLALGGMLHLGGYHDSYPIAAGGNQAYLAAAQFAAVATLLAIHSVEEAREPRQGRHIDVSVQECVVMGMENAIQFYDLEGVVRRREAGQQRWAGTGVFDCIDGQVYVMAGGIVPARFREANVHWLIDEGVEGAAQMLDPRWASQDFQTTEEARRIFHDLFAPFARQHTKEWLYHEGQSRRIPICPVNTPADLLGNRQLNARGHFVDVQHTASGKAFRMPGAPYMLSATPWKAPGPAPLLGEHSRQVLARAAGTEAAG